MRNIIITGGSSGIGFATAEALINKGDNISIISREITKLKKAVELLNQCRINDKQKITGYSADVGNYLSLKNAMEEIVSDIGAPDILITSAGIVETNYFEQLSINDFQKIMTTNYFGTVYATKLVMPYMIKKKRGHLVFISSMAGLVGSFGYTAYGPSKAALKNFAEALKLELNPKGIKVSICYPADTDTPQLAYENLKKPLETKKVSEAGGVFLASDVARAIVKGIERNQFAILTGRSNYLFYYLSNPLLSLWFKYVIKITR